MDKEECLLCERVWAGLGIAVGILILFISVDLISGGKLGGYLGKSASVADADVFIEEFEDTDND